MLTAGRQCRSAAVRLSNGSSVDLQEAYSRRLSQIEEGHPVRGNSPFDGAAAVIAAKTLHDLQLAQAEHDRWFHPDVYGLSKTEQLRHYTLHLAKIGGSLAEVWQEPTRWPDFSARRLPDLLLFGIKLSTVMGETLGDMALERSG